MTKKQLIDRLEHSKFRWVEKDDHILINWPEVEDKVKVDLEALPDLNWEQIKGFVYDGRNVSHLTRIVGYYSKVSNWNKSKLGELDDRQRGTYSVGNRDG